MKRLGEYHRGLTLEAKKVRFCSHALAEETNSSLAVNQVPSLNEGGCIMHWRGVSPV